MYIMHDKIEFTLEKMYYKNPTLTIATIELMPTDSPDVPLEIIQESQIRSDRSPGH